MIAVHFDSVGFQGIIQSRNNFSGWDFSQQDMRDASFDFSIADATDFSGSNVESGSFASTSLRGTNLVNTNLRRALFSQSDVANANFTGANVQVSTWDKVRNLTAQQIYSTASYQQKHLGRIGFVGHR